MNRCTHRCTLNCTAEFVCGAAVVCSLMTCPSQFQSVPSASAPPISPPGRFHFSRNCKLLSNTEKDAGRSRLCRRDASRVKLGFCCGCSCNCNCEEVGSSARVRVHSPSFLQFVSGSIRSKPACSLSLVSFHLTLRSFIALITHEPRLRPSTPASALHPALKRLSGHIGLLSSPTPLARLHISY